MPPHFVVPPLTWWMSAECVVGAIGREPVEARGGVGAFVGRVIDGRLVLRLVHRREVLRPRQASMGASDLVHKSEADTEGPQMEAGLPSCVIKHMPTIYIYIYMRERVSHRCCYLILIHTHIPRRRAQ